MTRGYVLASLYACWFVAFWGLLMPWMLGLGTVL